MLRTIRRPPHKLLASCLCVLTLLLRAFSLDALPGDLPESVMRLLGATRDTAATIAMQDVKSAIDHLHRRLGDEFHFFLVLAGHRSGSTMLRKLLNSHPNVTMYGEMFEQEFTHGNMFPVVSKGSTLTDAWKAIKRGLVNCSALSCHLDRPRLGMRSTTTHIGFKLMEDQIQNVGGVPTELPNGAIILHLRRNTLRAVISGILGKKGEITGGLHAKTNQEAASIRQQHSKMNVDVKLVRDRIEKRLFHDTFMLSQLTGDRRAMESFDRRCISHYENWVNPLVRPAQEAGTLDCLGLSHERLYTNLVPVHQTTPVLDLVANGQEIAAALRGSLFDYMLEQATSPVEVFRKLLRSDYITHSWHLSKISQRAR